LIFFYGCEKCSIKTSFKPPNWLKGEWVNGNSTFNIQDGLFEEKTPNNQFNHIKDGFKICKQGKKIKIISDGWVRQFEKINKDDLLYWIYESNPNSSVNTVSAALKRK